MKDVILQKLEVLFFLHDF